MENKITEIVSPYKVAYYHYWVTIDPRTQNIRVLHHPGHNSRQHYVMVNVRAARRYGIYQRSFSIPDEGGARVWYVKTTEGISETPYVNHFVVQHSPVPGFR